MDPRKAAAAINTYKKSANVQLNQALDALNAKDAKQTFITQDNVSTKLFRYSVSPEDAK